MNPYFILRSSQSDRKLYNLDITLLHHWDQSPILGDLIWTGQSFTMKFSGLWNRFVFESIRNNVDSAMNDYTNKKLAIKYDA